MERKRCPNCRRTKPVEEFNWKSRSEGKHQVRCRDCTKAQLKSHYRRNLGYYIQKALRRNREVYEQQKLLLLAYLADHPCVDCGEAEVVCLEFDHVRGEKRGNIAKMLGDYPWATIEAEIAKCDVRCANCHRRKTARQRGYYRSEHYLIERP